MKKGSETLYSLATVFLPTVPVLIGAIWFVALLDKRIALVEQNQTYMAQQLNELKMQLLRIGDNSEKIYTLMAKKGMLND